MNTAVTATHYESSWQIAPSNAVVGSILGLLFLYLMFRHFIFVLMVMDMILGWLRKFAWFPKEGKRRKTLIHWGLAWALFVGFLIAAGSTGWVKFIPQ